MDMLKHDLMAVLILGGTIEDQADAVINLIRLQCRDMDTYHNFIGLLNTIRLQEENNDALEREIRDSA